MFADAPLDVRARHVTGDLERAPLAYRIALLRHLIDPEAAQRHYAKGQYDSVWTGLETQERLGQAARDGRVGVDAIRSAALAMVRASIPAHLAQEHAALRTAPGVAPVQPAHAAIAARIALQKELHAVEVKAQHPAGEVEVLAPYAPMAEADIGLSSAVRQNRYRMTVRKESEETCTISDGMRRYRGTFTDRSAVQNELYRLFHADEAHFASDMEAFCAMPAEESRQMVFVRELETRYGRAHFSAQANETALGNARAAMRDLPQARLPGNQLALLMRVPMWTGEGSPSQIRKDLVPRPLILSVCAPALDECDEPEWDQYVDSQGALKESAYKLAMETLSRQIVQAASACPGHEVVLSAFGMNNYISKLQTEARAKAYDIGVANMRSLIEMLRAQRVAISYTDKDSDTDFWKRVNQGLAAPIGYAGKLPGAWVKDSVMIVNAWDPCSLVGNGCAKDFSMDGFVGRNSLVHEAHAHAILAWRNSLLDWQ